MNRPNDTEISASAYQWTYRAMSVLEKRLGVRIRLHHDEGQIEAGDIFVFNHFARFETFIPQYLIYRETGAMCRSVAASEFFVEGDAFSNYLLSVGGVPNHHPRLLPYLAEEVLRGRKVIVFPEGGMVKDRRILDSRGRYRIYSPVARERRKHHTGAAILGITIEAFKQAMRAMDAAGDEAGLAAWAERIGLADSEALRAVAARPTLIVPANITFYPIRVTDNLLQKGVELFAGGLKPKLAEELLIESNILLRQTDMDIRLGDAVRPGGVWRWWERRVLTRVARRLDSLDALFALRRDSGAGDVRFAAWFTARRTLKLRDAYMHEMYEGVTVNLSHLASRLVLAFIESGVSEAGHDLFHWALYLAARAVRRDAGVHAHDGIADPNATAGLIEGRHPGLQQFVSSKACAELVERRPNTYHFRQKLRHEHDFHEVRIENLVAVYANEVAPIAGVRSAVLEAMEAARKVDARALSRLLFEDEEDAYRWDRQSYHAERHAEINRQQTATRLGAPYLLVPRPASSLGVVLVHGFLASPAELSDFAGRLEAAGHPVMGVRLKGHGTSPWDLRERSWQDWLDSVRRGYRIMAGLTDRVALVGFSTGGALSLILAAERPHGLAGVAAVSAPLKFRNRNLVFVPIVHGVNRLARWVSSAEGVMPFQVNDSEHPEINYRHIPIRGLYELRLVVDALEERLADVVCPVLVVQGDDDHVVDARSADLIVEALGSAEKTRHMVTSSRHGILNEDIGDTRQAVLEFVGSLAADGA